MLLFNVDCFLSCLTDLINNELDSNINKSSGYRIVNQQNVLWTCHKTCKIEFADCVYCVCSICYAQEILKSETSDNTSGRTASKRRRTSRSKDDDQSICNHSISSLVPFMDSTFFTTKYKDTIRHEGYSLPMVCSMCKSELVDKPNFEHQQDHQKMVDV